MIKNINKLNILFASITAVLIVLLVQKIVVYNAFDRFYYGANVSNPEEHPIYIHKIGFNAPHELGEYPDFYQAVAKVNYFVSNWGADEYTNAHKPLFLPKNLFVQYIDFRTKNYYSETIPLPQEKIKTIFSDAKKNRNLKDLSYGSPHMGLILHVGIADQGNLVFWLIGNQYEYEFHRVQLQPKPFPKQMMLHNKIQNMDKEKFLIDIFREMPDSIQTNILNTKPKTQYQDSTPIYFKDLKKY